MDRDKLKHQLLVNELQKSEAEKMAQEHTKVLESIRSIIQTESGKIMFRYLFKYISPTDLPELGLDSEMMRERLGFFRAGRSIWELAVQAEPFTASQLLASLEKEKNDERLLQEKILNGRK